MRFLFLDAQTLNAKEAWRDIAPCDNNLYYAVCHFYSLHHKFVPRLLPLQLKINTYLEAIFIAFCTDDNLLEGSYSIHR